MGRLKTCPRCAAALPRSAFYRRRTGPHAGDLLSPCRACSVRKAMEWAKANYRRHLESCRAYRARRAAA